MTQSELLEFLKKNQNELYTSEQLSDMFKLNNPSTSLKRLKEFGDLPVFMVRLPGTRKHYFVYIEKARKHCKKKGHYTCNNITMSYIEV